MVDAVRRQGRPSKLSPEQWTEAERRITVEGESQSSVARYFGVSPSLFSEKFSDRKVVIEKAAVQVAEVQNVLESLSETELECTLTLAEQLREISSNMAIAATFSSKTAGRLSQIAHSQLRHVGNTDAPMTPEQIEQLKTVHGVNRMANDASVIPLGLLNANKESVKIINNATAVPKTTVDVKKLSAATLKELALQLPKVS